MLGFWVSDCSGSIQEADEIEMEWICLFAKWKDNQMFSFSKYSYCFVVIDICFLLIFLYYCMQKDAVSIWEWACCELGNVKYCCIFCSSGVTLSERIKGLWCCFALINCGFCSTYDTSLACITLPSFFFIFFAFPPCWFCTEIWGLLRDFRGILVIIHGLNEHR